MNIPFSVLKLQTRLLQVANFLPFKACLNEYYFESSQTWFASLIGFILALLP